MAPRILVLALALLVAGCGNSSVAATLSPSPSPSPTLSPAAKSEIGTLEARPLRLPTVLKPGVCRANQQDPNSGLWGNDPVYAAGGPETKTSFGNYYDVSAIIKPGLAGPILLRGRDLITPNRPVVFVTSFGATPSVFRVGPVYGTDSDFGSQYTELAIDTSYPAASSYPINGTEYGEWYWRQGVGKGWTGCIGFQIDGPTFSESFNVNVSNS